VTATAQQCEANRILLVDDEPSIRRLFRLIISSNIPDCTVDQACNGAEALESFGKDHHSVLLMDLHMPIMDGQSAFQEIMRLCTEKNWETPAVVFCTGYAPPDSVMGFVQENSAHGLLIKPVGMDVLVDAVKSRLQRTAA
jgi:two-component system response regulator ResD